MKLLWATRGRYWGSRFLRQDVPGDPLVIYDDAFRDAGDEQKMWRPGNEYGALRFPDPDGSKDQAGRVIVHEFVVFPPDSEIDSFGVAFERVWAEVADRFRKVLNEPTPDWPATDR